MFDGLKAALKAALHRLQGVSAPRVVAAPGMAKNILPYSQWAALPKRKAAKSAGTRQNRRRDKFKAMFDVVSKAYPGEPRAARRRMALAISKRRPIATTPVAA